MKRLVVLGAVLSSIFLTFNKSHSIQYWAIHYGESEFDTAQCIKQVSSDEYIVAGSTRGLNYYSDIRILNLNGSGNVNWQKTYNGLGDNEDYPTSIQVTADGGYIVAGSTWSHGGTSWWDDIWILKLDNNGDINWQKSYGGIYRDYPDCIHQTSDGGYVVAGFTASFGTGYDAWVLKLTDSGDVSWQKIYGGISEDFFHTIIQTADGGYIVAGETNPLDIFDDDYFWVVNLDSNGNINWQKMYRQSGPGSISILQSSDGGYMLVGNTKTNALGLKDIYVLKLDSYGDVIWHKTIGGSGTDTTGWSGFTQETTDGGYIIAGSTDSFGSGDSDSWLVKLDSDGNISWQKTYGEFGASAVQQTLDGGYIMVGNIYPPEGSISNFWALKLDSNGDIPNCSIIANTNATTAIPSISVSNTNATVQETSAVIIDTITTPQNTETEPFWICCYNSDDFECDGFLNEVDNCPNISNPVQEDTYPPLGNGIGDACDCEGNFNCDADVDGSDAALLKVDFGRSNIEHPCIAGDTCNGDFNCDGDVDGTDASLFKSDFGRSSMQSPCPACVQGEWCGYGEPFVSGYWDSGCQGSFMEFAGGTCGEDEIVADVAGNVIHLTHYNAFYNCCPDDIPVTMAVEGNLLRLQETESNVGCRCMCCYTVESEIADLEPGEYTIEYCWKVIGGPCETLMVTVPD